MLICQDWKEKIDASLIFVIFHVTDLHFGGKIKRKKRSSSVTDKAVVAATPASQGNRSFI